MRIAYVSADTGVPIFGRKGCSIHAQEVLRAMKKCAVEIDLFALRLDGQPPAGLETVAVHHLPALPKGDRAAREQAALAANGELRSALEKAAREAPFDLIYERYSLWSCAAMEFARDLGIPGLLEVNAPLIEEQAQYRELVDRASAEQVAERVFGAATALLAVSDEVAEYLEHYPAARNKVQVIPNGVDPERFPANLKPSLPGTPGTFTVGFVGTLKAWHGLGILVEALALMRRRNPQTRLLLVGDGPEHGRLVADLSERGLLQAVHFTGAVAPSQVPGLLASMDAAVAPYPKLSHFYFSPLKVYEYMAAGLPVVASRVGQLEKLIEPEVNGLLVPPGDAPALAEALGQLQSDPELRLRIGQAARAKVLRDHTWDRAVQRILRLAGMERQPHFIEKQ